MDERPGTSQALTIDDEQMSLGVELSDPPEWPLELYLILYPKELEERVIETLESIGVPGYTEFPKLIGRGRRIRHFDNQIWPGANGAVFTVIGAGLAAALVPPFQALNRQLDERSHGTVGIHIFAMPCRQVI